MGCESSSATQLGADGNGTDKKTDNIEELSVDELFAKLEASKDAKSLLKKHLTKKVFEALKDKKTELGCDLKSCIRSGCDNLDSGVGLYASDADAYVVFADLFNAVICDYHKLKSLDDFKHPAQNFAWDDAFPGNLDEDGEFVLSTRIRVARNVAEYPLRGGMNEDQTMELEQKIKAILESMDDADLKGKYYPLAGMDEETRAKLVADHFLFKKGDRFLASAGINNFWPNGRGIFFNDKKTFLVWINEEDQLRIISMEQGGNVKSVFNRLEKAVNILCKKLDFAFNEQLGYLTACPTNIGCGERASVHIKLPFLAENYEEIEAVATKFNLQIRGIHGEHSESKGGVYDVSNKRRLGISEWDGVKDLVQGVQELIVKEKAAKAAAPEKAEAKEEVEEEVKEEVKAEEPAAEDDADSVDALFAKLEASEEAKSLLKKHLTKEVFEALKDKKTELGCDLKSCIRSGCDNLDSGVGVYASDADAYVVFADLFNAVICDYHKLDSLDDFKHPAQNFAFDDELPADLDESGEYVVSTRIRVARNVAGYPLRGGMNEEQTMELEQKIKVILESMEDEDLKGKYYPLAGMDEETREQLVADHFLFKKGDRFLASAGINNFWPKGRGIFFNDNKTFLVWINEEDQLRIISMEQGGNVKSVFNRLEKAVNILCEKLDFAFNEQLGYLTACPTNIGCGERASVHIKIPLTSEEEINEIATKFNLQIRGIHGEHSESKGGVFDVSNKRRLGISEWDGVKDLIQGSLALIEAEKKAKAEQATE